MSLRYAMVYGARHVGEVEAYMPDNYRVVQSAMSSDARPRLEVLIAGEDAAGWTLDGYVIPRLGSGMMPAVEISEPS